MQEGLQASTEERDAHEESFISAFVEPHRIKRMLYLRTRKKGRSKFLAELASLYFLRGERCVHLPSNIPHPTIVRLLKGAGSPDICYAVSTCNYSEGVLLPMLTAIDNTDFDGGMLVSCIAGELAYCCGEDGPPRLIVSLNPDRIKRHLEWLEQHALSDENVKEFQSERHE